MHRGASRMGARVRWAPRAVPRLCMCCVTCSRYVRARLSLFRWLSKAAGSASTNPLPALCCVRMMLRWTGLLVGVAVTAAASPAYNVDQFAVSYLTPSESSLGAMPVGNGRTSVNVWADQSTGDVMLSLGLADALDENSNLLKLGLVRVQLQPPLDVRLGFNQTLLLVSSATVEIRVGGVVIRVWVDANTSTVRASVQPGAHPLMVLVKLDHQRRLDGPPIDAGSFGNGWGGGSGSFCYSNGSVATFVGIYPDKLLRSPSDGTIAWYHRNDATRSDMYRDTMRQQGLTDCGASCWDPLTNRSFGAALVGDADFRNENSTVIISAQSSKTREFAIGVASAQTSSAQQFEEQLRAAETRARAEIVSSRHRTQHELWWEQFFNRSWIVVSSSNPHADQIESQANSLGYSRHDGLAGDQHAIIRSSAWPCNGESPGNCTAQFTAPGVGKQLNRPSAECVAHVAKVCDETPHCVAFALSKAWHGGYFPQLYTNGMPGDPGHSNWVLFVNATSAPGPAPTPAPFPATSLSDGYLVSRQNILMRYMDVCSSGRIGGGLRGEDYFALKYNGGILTSEPVPKEDYRAWGPGQWWQNLRLPYYAMLAEGGKDIFRPLLRWYAALLPMALRRTQLWFKETDAAGQDLRRRRVKGAFFHETMTQFGTFVPSEKGYHCTSIRSTNWTVDWAGNEAINLHREGSVELLMLAIDYIEHTLDIDEFKATVLPLAIAVTDFVSSYYGRTPSGQLEIWPTQSLEGYRPGGYPPTRNNTVSNDMPWVAGLHAVLPRLIRLANATTMDCDITTTQLHSWTDLLSVLPPLPTASKEGDLNFAAAQLPYPPHAVIGGSEQPYMYPVHPYRLATVMGDAALLDIGRRTIGYNSTHPAESKIDIGFGWKQGVLNVALLGLRSEAMRAVLGHAKTPPGAMRFPAYLPNMQDFRPNEDHLSNMRTALQYMLMQHSDANNTIGLLPAWPCGNWSVSFKLHAPELTVVEGNYNHTTGRLWVRVEPPERKHDVVVMGCAGAENVEWGSGK